MTALDFLKLEDRQTVPDDEDPVISIHSWKVRNFNEHQLERIFSTLEFDLSSIKLHPYDEELINYGTIAA